MVPCNESPHIAMGGGGVNKIPLSASETKTMKHFLIFVPTFDTKVTEYLCSGWVFFLETNLDFLTSHF